MLGSIADATGRRKRWILLFFRALSRLLLGILVRGSRQPACGCHRADGLRHRHAFHRNRHRLQQRHDALAGPALAHRAPVELRLGPGLCKRAGKPRHCPRIFFAANPETGRTLLGFEPVLGLDPATQEGDRAVGPFSALWYLVFVLPMFLFVPDTPHRAKIGSAIRLGLSSLRESLSHARANRNIFLFLLANMVFKDGLVALFAFGGIYSAGQLGWGGPSKSARSASF
ncbi:MFS transporter [Roseibium salinum]|nr:MFS transporter [Roseibium salinum]